MRSLLCRFTITSNQRGPALCTVAVLKAQPVVPTASDELRAAGLTLMRFGEELGTYLLKQADVFVSEAVKSAGKEFGKRLVQSPFWWALATALLLAANSVASWLH
jgi:hypothetical protein